MLCRRLIRISASPPSPSFRCLGSHLSSLFSPSHRLVSPLSSLSLGFDSLLAATVQLRTHILVSHLGLYSYHPQEPRFFPVCSVSCSSCNILHSFMYRDLSTTSLSYHVEADDKYSWHMRGPSLVSPQNSFRSTHHMQQDGCMFFKLSSSSFQLPTETQQSWSRG